MIKKLAFILVVLFLGTLTAKAQFTESKERKKMWRKSKHRGKNREAFNPYLEKKQKDKPSSIEAKSEKKGSEKMRSTYKRENKRKKKKMGTK